MVYGAGAMEMSVFAVDVDCVVVCLSLLVLLLSSWHGVVQVVEWGRRSVGSLLVVLVGL